MMNTVTEITTCGIGDKQYHISIKSHSDDKLVIIEIGDNQVSVNANELRVAVARATSQRINKGDSL